MGALRVWANVYSADGTTRLGGGPLQPESVSQTRALDGAGSFSMSFPGTDPRALALLQIRNQVEILLEDPYTNAVVTLPRGVIFKRGASDSGGRISLNCDGPDLMQTLKDKNTLLARVYTLQNTSTVMSALAAIAGWTVSGSLSGTTTARYDGETVLKAMQSLLTRTGYHMRLSASTPNQVEIGAFGSDSGYIAVHPSRLERNTPSLYNRQNKYIAIESVQMDTEGTDMGNYLVPIGGGEGEAALTLEKSTRTTPYTIQTVTGPDGRTIYFLRDTVSETAYGTIQKVGTFKDISPITNSAADVINAANALYDAAVAWLVRHKDPLQNYDLNLRGRVGMLQPGDKIRVIYKGAVYRDGVISNYIDIDQMFWILEVTDRMGVTGFSTGLRIASVDRYELDTVDVIIGALDELQVNNLKIQPYPTTSCFVWQREMSPGYTADIPVRFTDSCLKLIRLMVQLRTSPFRITAQSATASGDHRHAVIAPSLSAPYAGTWTVGYAEDQDGNPIGIGLYTSVTRAPIAGDEVRTFTGSGTHTHPISYGISDDTQTPNVISVYVDGVDRSVALGGPWSPGVGTPITIDLDPGLMTGYMNLPSPGLQTTHTISVRCTAGRGRLEAVVEMYQIVQAIRVT